jgi:hypothetical protein
VTVLDATAALNAAGISAPRVIGLRGGTWCAYGWRGDRCLTTFANAAGDAVRQLLELAAMQQRVSQ